MRVMIKHIVAWNFIEGLSNADKHVNAEKIKQELEGLKLLIPGIISMKVVTEPLKTGDFDFILISEFESEEALASYQTHKEHQRISQFGRSILCNRKCIDFQMESE